MFRRHTKGDREIHFEPALRVVSGNYVTAKRRGVLEGVDFGLTGEVGTAATTVDRVVAEAAWRGVLGGGGLWAHRRGGCIASVTLGARTLLPSNKMEGGTC